MFNLTFLAAPVVFMQTNFSQLAYTFWVHGKYICVLLKFISWHVYKNKLVVYVLLCKQKLNF